MSVLSPLSSPEYQHAYILVPKAGTPLSSERPKSRRLTHDLEQEEVLTKEDPLPCESRGWSFLDLYDNTVGIDQEIFDFPFDENGDPIPLPSSLPQISPSSDSCNNSSQSSSAQSEDTHTLQNDLKTPLRARDVLLGETLELGNCTYELEVNNITSTLTKLSRSRSFIIEKTALNASSFACNVSSTPLETRSINLTSDLTTCHLASPSLKRRSCIPSHINFENELYKSPIKSSNKHTDVLPLEITINPADSTVDLEVESGPDRPAKSEELLVKGADPNPENMKIHRTNGPAKSTTFSKRSSIPGLRVQTQKSILPVMAGRLAQKTGPSLSKLQQGLRPTSSANSLSRIPNRNSLLPTSMKSKSHDRINATAGSTGFSFKK